LFETQRCIGLGASAPFPLDVNRLLTYSIYITNQMEKKMQIALFENEKIKSKEDALTLALVLMATAPSEEKAEEIKKMAMGIANQLSDKEVDLCMKAAEVVLQHQREEG